MLDTDAICREDAGAWMRHRRANLTDGKKVNSGPKMQKLEMDVAGARVQLLTRMMHRRVRRDVIRRPMTWTGA